MTLRQLTLTASLPETSLALAAPVQAEVDYFTYLQLHMGRVLERAESNSPPHFNLLWANFYSPAAASGSTSMLRDTSRGRRRSSSTGQC